MKPDRNYHSIADVEGFDLPELVLDLPAAGVDAAQYDDILKFSNARRGRIGTLVIRCGSARQRENAIDFNRSCADIHIERAVLDAGEQNAITIKGGCRNITFGEVWISRAGGHCDVELGNHSDQVFARTTGVSFCGIRREDFRPARVRWGLADRPKVTGACYVEYQWGQSLLLWAYVWAKRLKNARG